MPGCPFRVQGPPCWPPAPVRGLPARPVGRRPSPPVRARANNFQVCKQYILQGLGIGAMPTQIICTTELRDGRVVAVLPEWRPEPLEVHMIYPFELSFSTLVSAFYETACEVIVENTARA